MKEPSASQIASIVRSSRFVIAMLALILSPGAACAQTLVTFDDIVIYNGLPSAVSTQYASQGVTFDGYTLDGYDIHPTAVNDAYVSDANAFSPQRTVNHHLECRCE